MQKLGIIFSPHVYQFVYWAVVGLRLYWEGGDQTQYNVLNVKQ